MSDIKNTHMCIQTQMLGINESNPFKELNEKILYLTGAIVQLQAHCVHLQDILSANGIALPDNLESDAPSQTPPSPPSPP